MGTRKLLLGRGVNDWNQSTYIKGKPIREYELWSGMIKRCFSLKYKESRKTYTDVSCCDEWLSMTKFIIDVSGLENYNRWLSGGWCLDKDILIKGNKKYSIDTCCFVPKEINSLFTKSNSLRGELPIGVQKIDYSKYHKNMKSNVAYRVQLWLNGKRRTLGHYQTVSDAFNAYKQAKELEIKRVAEKWKGLISENVYLAMVNYTVDICD